MLTRFCVATTAALAFAGGAAAGPSVELRVLSYNTHGLAGWIAGDDPEGRFPLIAERVNRYDVALLQEDWSHHELLRRGATHAIVERGNGSRLALARVLPIFGGSGLTVLAGFEPGRAVAVTREFLGTCAGWLDGASDCFASKGFLRLRLRVADGLELDFYDTHLDAGGGDADQRAREVQLARLGDRIRALSGDGAVVIGGDFNLGFEREAQRAALLAFAGGLGLRDTGAARADPERWRRIDYILYRSGAGVSLEVLEAGEAAEFHHEGRPLSDHPALAARFRVSAAP